MPLLWAGRVREEMRITSNMTDYSKIDKARFENYLAILRRIVAKQDELTVIKHKLSTPQGVKISDMPKNTRRAFDKVAFLVQEKIEIENDIKKLQRYQKGERTQLTNAIKGLEVEDNIKVLTRDRQVLIYEASVLKLRYICGFTWPEVAETIFGTESDFQEKKEDYLRKIFRYHGNAFTDFRKLKRVS